MYACTHCSSGFPLDHTYMHYIVCLCGHGREASHPHRVGVPSTPESWVRQSLSYGCKSTLADLLYSKARSLMLARYSSRFASMAAFIAAVLSMAVVFCSFVRFALFLLTGASPTGAFSLSAGWVGGGVGIIVRLVWYGGCC